MQLNPDEPIDNTSPKKVAARGFYTGSLFSNASGSMTRSKQEVSRYQSEQGYTVRTNPTNLPDSSIYGAQARNQRTPELPHVNAFSSQRGSGPSHDPYQERANVSMQGSFKGAQRGSQAVGANGVRNMNGDHS